MNHIVYDIETKTWAHEHPGQWDDIPHFGLAVAGARCDCHVDYIFVASFTRETHPAIDLYKHLVGHNRIVGFNNIRFDNPIVAHDAGRAVEPLNMRSFDILTELRKLLGHRLKLEQLARATLGASKLATGIDAVQWWKDAVQLAAIGRPEKARQHIDRIIDYCRQDVALTSQLYSYAQQHGRLHYTDYRDPGTTHTVEVNWT